jgi:hypothetical protein
MMKNFLRKWLEIKDPIEVDWDKFDKKVEDALAKLDRSFTQRIARFSVVNCLVCNKGLIAGRDAIYRNSKGQVFCSHDCIDATPKQIRKAK